MKNLLRIFVIGILFINPVKSIAQNELLLKGYSYSDKKLSDLSEKRIPFAVYYNSVNNDSLDVSLTLNRNLYTMWIKAVSQDDINLYGGILIQEGTQHYAFIDALQRAKADYEGLIKWAKEKNITRYNKDLNISFDASVFYFIGKRWQTEAKVPFDFKFIVRNVNDSLRYFLVIQTNHIKLSLNGHEDLNGYSLFFQSPEAIENFAQLISPSKVNTFVSHVKKNNYRKEEFVFSRDSLKAYEKRKLQESERLFVAKHPFFGHFSWGIQTEVNYMFLTKGMLEKLRYKSSYFYYTYSPIIDIPVGVYGNYSFGKCFVRSSVSMSITNLFVQSEFDLSRNDMPDFISSVAKKITLDIPVVFGMNVLKSNKSQLKARIMIGPDVRFLSDVLKTNFLTTKHTYVSKDKMILGTRGGLLFEYKLFDLGINYTYFSEGNKIYVNGAICKYSMNSLNMTFGMRLFPR